MFRRSALIAGLCVVGLLVACGEKKEANNPTGEKGASKEETPKWEGSSSAPPEENKPKSSASASGGAVQEGAKLRTDQYDKEHTDVVLKRAARQVRDNCGAAKDDNGKAIGPWGKLTVQVQLMHNGHSNGTTVPSPYEGKPAGKCIEKAFANLSFPPWTGADATVEWEVELNEPGKEPAKK